ncbi:Nitric oxide synthase, inducible,Nitric oxide synthase, endothelial,Nitric oxide synthase oxygenase,Nitric oxide synthase, brain,Nitric oxide synthase [Mytilus coruscus]|uniref:Nitric oxide synthase n=1 Tax=Mytilus coruscus TaxID=42192 RepID=A0A6J8AG51_MYTCO|nr:Nitric oxide synthase, inducible,Nitric oxide synthase, endothelial,Nitric oxide synthase oxygenase,Nitric oxide synthase, brain,Nitric oxide synthase [Mytilus coruscus]
MEFTGGRIFSKNGRKDERHFETKDKSRSRKENVTVHLPQVNKRIFPQRNGLTVSRAPSPNRYATFDQRVLAAIRKRHGMALLYSSSEKEHRMSINHVSSFAIVPNTRINNRIVRHDGYEKTDLNENHAPHKHDKRTKIIEKERSKKKENPVTNIPVKLKNFSDKETVLTDTLQSKAIENISCGHQCLGSLYGTLTNPNVNRSKDELLEQAKDFFQQYYTSLKSNDSSEHRKRWDNVVSSVNKTGTYDLTVDELEFGSKQAWRNAPRCIGRIQWANLQIFDARNVKTGQGMFEAICRHIKYATNNGKIRSAITVFKQRTDENHDYRVWNTQLISYAGYKQPDGSIIGDPINVDFTETVTKMGWRGRNGRFDVLPIIVQANGGAPEWFEIPSKLILQVPIKHPKYPKFNELGLKWFCVPAVSNMKFDCGGLEFTASPFNGWYMSTEIACRDFCDKQRYNLLEEIAEALGLDTKSNPAAWKDNAVVETNIAVLHSFQTIGCTLVDQHTASEQFMTFMHNEYKQRGGCPADWVWAVSAWTSLMTKALSKRIKCTILFATETGKAEKFANTLHKIFRQTFNSRILKVESYNVLEELRSEQLVLFVASTFGNGDPPENGKTFAKALPTAKDRSTQKNSMHLAVARRNSTYQNGSMNGRNSWLGHLKFSVFGLGSRAYPKFCEFGHFIDKTMETLGASRIHVIGEGDELSGQEISFRDWAKNVYQVSCNYFKVGNKQGLNDAADVLAKSDMTWCPDRFRVIDIPRSKRLPLSQELSKVFGKNVSKCRLKGRVNLGDRHYSRQTILARIDIREDSDAMGYNPGDHVLLFSNNHPDLVNGIIKHLKDVTASDSIQLQYNTSEDVKVNQTGNQNYWNDYGRFPSCSLKDLLGRYLDITTPPSQEFLSILSGLAARQEDKQRIKRIAENTSVYEDWKSHGMPNILDLLRDYPSLQVTPAFLISQLPLLLPRYYSISSALDAAPGEVHVTVAVVEYQTPGRQKISFGETYLYFGCRHMIADNIYKNEIQQCENESILTRCYFAYSREQGMKKTYVQDLIQRNGTDVFRLIVKDNGHFYICGSIQMASDVKQMLRYVIQTIGRLSDSQLDHYMDKMKDENRLHEDIFGLAVRLKKR